VAPKSSATIGKSYAIFGEISATFEKNSATFWEKVCHFWEFFCQLNNKKFWSIPNIGLFLFKVKMFKR
jgi:hypothetical protein